MLKNNEIEQPVMMFLPKGEWKNALLRTLAVANLRLEQYEPDYDSYMGSDTTRCLQYRIIPTSDAWSAQQKTPRVLFQEVRAREVYQNIIDPDIEVNCGWTGSDVALEDNAPGFALPNEIGGPVVVSDPRAWEVPLVKAESLDRIPDSNLYLGLTPRYQAENRVSNQVRIADAFSPKDLIGTNLYTSYPRLSQLFLGQSGLSSEEISRVNIKYRAGGIEGIWRFDRKNVSIVDIGDSFSTAIQNLVYSVRKILQAKLYCIEGPDISPREQNVIDGLREDLERSAKRVAAREQRSGI